MAEHNRQTRVEEVDWLSLMPFLRLFRTFHMSIHPTKLFVALILVVLVYLSGLLLDQLWGRDVYSGEVRAHATMGHDGFKQWMQSQAERVDDNFEQQVELVYDSGGLEWETLEKIDRAAADRFSQLQALSDEAYDKLIASAQENAEGVSDEVRDRVVASLQKQQALLRQSMQDAQPKGRFATALEFELDAFQRLVHASMSMNIGGTGLVSGGVDDRHTVVGALYDMVIVLPRWMLMVHPFFTIVYGLILLVLWSVLGGALTRMSAVQATQSRTPNVVEAVRYATSRFGAFLMAPLIPVILAGVLAGLLVLAGFVAFGIPYVNQATALVGGLLFIIAILLGLGLALVKLSLALGFGLYYPAIALEDSDAFDAISRATGYLCYRLWQVLLYNLAALVYLALTYILVGGVIFLSLLGAHYCISLGADALSSGAPFDQMMPAPELGRLTYPPGSASLSHTESVAAVLMMVWVYLFVGLSAAYALSYYFSASTWIYLLLRRSADGTDYSEIHIESAIASSRAPSGEPAEVPTKVEPDGTEQ